jgi:hypothetical protein
VFAWNGLRTTMGPLECEVVLQEDNSERRLPHTFAAPVEPGTRLFLEGKDWAVVDVIERPGDVLEVVCRRQPSGADLIRAERNERTTAT